MKSEAKTVGDYLLEVPEKRIQSLNKLRQLCLKYLSESGISDLEVLKTATSNPSKAFKLGDKGFVKEGFSADLLLIDGDPTTDISHISNIIRIWKQGVNIK